MRVVRHSAASLASTPDPSAHPPLTPPTVASKNPRHCRMSLQGQNHPWLRTAGLEAERQGCECPGARLGLGL